MKIQCLFFMLAILLATSLCSAVTIVNSTVGSFYVNETLEADEVRVEPGNVSIYNLSSSARLHNVNTTSNITFYNLGVGVSVRNVTASLQYFLASALLRDYAKVVSSGDGIAVSSCVESWSCTAWIDSSTGTATCDSGSQVRTCADVSLCGTLLSKPAESQECFETAYKEEANSIISFAAVVLVLMAVAAIMIVLIKGPDPVAIVVALVAIIILVIGLFIALRFEVSAFV